MIKVYGTQVVPTRFPDNTTQVWKLPEEWFGRERLPIWWSYTHTEELFTIAQLKELFPNSILIIEYLPFARQDKDISNEQTFALIPFSRLLNALNFEEVHICDPHSERALRLINNSKAYYPHAHLFHAWNQTKSDVVCYPDKGARTKYIHIYKPEDYPFICGDKTRDQLTGHITGYELLNPDPSTVKGKNILIVDDICDGGMTFIILAKELYSRGAKEVNLFVSHGLFTKGIKPLRTAGIKKIFTKEGEAIHLNDGVAIRKLEG